MSALANELASRFGPRFVVSRSKLDAYTRSESYHVGQLPFGAVFPRTTEEVVAIVRACAAARMPLIPYGAGTSLEGHTVVEKRGVIVDFREMNSIIAVNAADMDCTCQPGVTREQLNSHLRDTGLCFPLDPGANATIGGMVATSASGTTAVRYGTMKENVLSLEVVLADGRVIRTGRRPRKTAAGYDLTHLFTGSEGTLGIITEVCLRLRGIPEITRSAVCTFALLQQATESVIDIVHLGIPVSRIELMDEAQVQACNRYTQLNTPVAPTLLFEFQGSLAETEDHILRVRQAVEEHGGNMVDWATGPQDNARLWKARHAALAAAKSLRPGSVVLITDVAVPISQLATCIAATRADIDGGGLCATIVGHVGDGNFHVFYVMDPDDRSERARIAALHERLARRAIGLGGTCTGEHGIGLGKKNLLQEEMGTGAVDVMRLIKRSLDPGALFNPGKIFD